MQKMALTKTRIFAGAWEGVLQTDVALSTAPALQVTHLDASLEGIDVQALPENPGYWSVRIPIPTDALSDGMQTYLITETTSGEKLGSFSVLAGEPLAEDMQAEIGLLRAELDMLKRAFRRHCVETMS